MKRTLLFLFASAAILAGCSKSEPTNPEPIPEKKQGVDLSFVKDNKLSSGQTVEAGFKINVVLLWKADGKDLTYKLADGLYAYDAISKTNFTADYSYMNVVKERYDLAPGKYTVATVTDDTDFPKYAYSYTNFTVKAGEYVALKKNVTNMNSYTYTAW